MNENDRGALRTPDWYRTATRWTQLTFTDDDPGRYDLDFWADVMRRTRSNALCISAGGYLAFYPTTIPYHHRSARLGDSDPLGDLVVVARSLGMHVMARVDPHAIRDDAAQAHPEWLARDRDGNPMPHQSFAGLWQTDPFSTYNSEFITEVALEITRTYDIDALFANRWEGPQGVSYSEAAARDFHDATGFELPFVENPHDDAWPAYHAWRSRRLSELVVLWDDAVRSVRPHVRFIPNRGEMLTRDLVPELVHDRYPIFFVDKQGRGRGEALWGSGRVGKRARGLYPDRPVALITSVGPESAALRWKDSVTDPHELISWICDGFAHGALPWFTKFKAECFDTRWVEPMVTAFGLHAAVEPIYATLPPTTDVLILDTRPSASKGPSDPFHAYQRANNAEDGFCQALVEARIPYEFVATEALSAQRLAHTQLLVIPGLPRLTNEQSSVLEDFVASGGSVIAGFATGPDSSDDDALPLGHLFGVRVVEKARGPIKNKYLAIGDTHPIAAGYAGAQRIVGGTHLVGVEAAPDTDVVFSFVPDYPDLPMEEVYPRPGVVRPAVIARTQSSGGRTVYFAFNLGEIFADVLQSDHARLIANAVRWALGDHGSRVEVNGPGFADVAVRADDNAVAVTIVNLNNPQAMRGQNRETIPLPPQEVVLRLPDGVAAATARLVIADTPVDLEIEDGVARATVPRVDYLELLQVTWLR